MVLCLLGGMNRTESYLYPVPFQNSYLLPPVISYEENNMSHLERVFFAFVSNDQTYGMKTTYIALFKIYSYYLLVHLLPFLK